MSREYEENEDVVWEDTYRHYDNSSGIYRSISAVDIRQSTVNDHDDKYRSISAVDLKQSTVGDHDDDNNSGNSDMTNSKNDIAMIKNPSICNDPLIDYAWAYNENNEMAVKMPISVSMPMLTPMPVRNEQQGTKTEPKIPQKEGEREEVEIPFWTAGIDRFTNWIAKPNISPASLLSFTKEIMDQLNDMNLLDSDNNSNVAVKVLTYICYTNLLLCRIEIDNYRTCDFQIGIYRTQNGDCLFDVQELSGEHLTFARFLHLFKSQLQQREIIEASTFTPNNYGLDMEINLESFDCL